MVYKDSLGLSTGNLQCRRACSNVLEDLGDYPVLLFPFIVLTTEKYGVVELENWLLWYRSQSCFAKKGTGSELVHGDLTLALLASNILGLFSLSVASACSGAIVEKFEVVKRNTKEYDLCGHACRMTAMLERSATKITDI